MIFRHRRRRRDPSPKTHALVNNQIVLETLHQIVFAELTDGQNDIFLAEKSILGQLNTFNITSTIESAGFPFIAYSYALDRTLISYTEYAGITGQFTIRGDLVGGSFTLSSSGYSLDSHPDTDSLYYPSINGIYH